LALVQRANVARGNIASHLAGTVRRKREEALGRGADVARRVKRLGAAAGGAGGAGRLAGRAARQR